MRYYYKSSDGKGFYNLTEPSTDPNLIQITQEEFEAIPTDINELKEFLKK